MFNDSRDRKVWPIKVVWGAGVRYDAMYVCVFAVHKDALPDLRRRSTDNGHALT